ncbi:hypothetical protein [Nocardia concava]|uniref:hypothetical protein n=1 Tax=Nocardia concava TaxID=257281 RepID=UPI0012F8ADB0|nr:hypothetical protein [Nocardia concava]
MTLPPWITPPDDDNQRAIDEKLAARMGITVEQLHEIDRQMAEDVRARDAIPPTERIVDGSPKFNKGFGPVTSENTIEPGEMRAHEKLPLPPPPPPKREV